MNFEEVHHNVYKNIHQIFFIMLVGYVRFLVRSTKDLETGTCSLNETELNYFHNFWIVKVALLYLIYSFMRVS